MTRHELTARIAYEIFTQRERAPGRHREDWLAAEAIVALCLAFASELVKASEPAGAEEQAETLEERAMALLEVAAAEIGRKAVATKLGYKSPSTVGRYLRGERPLSEKLAERIVANLSLPAPARRERRAA